MNKFHLMARRLATIQPKLVGNHVTFGWRERLVVTGEACDSMIDAVNSGDLSLEDAHKNVVWWRESAATTAELSLLESVRNHLTALEGFKHLAHARDRFCRGGRLVA